MHYKLTGLDQNIIYSVRVYGYSRGGAGTQSPTLEFILGQLLIDIYVSVLLCVARSCVTALYCK